MAGLHTRTTTSPTSNPSLGGYLGHANPTAGYPMGFNIEADPREMRNCAAENGWLLDPYLDSIGAYHATLKDHPNPPPANLTDF